MKYLKSYIGNADAILDEMLDKHIQNDLLLDSNFITVEMELTSKDDYIGLMYRMLWETVYLRRQPGTLHSKIIIHDKKVIAKIAVSLSEAITYVKSVAPPIYKEKVSDALTSFGNIVSMVDYNLKDTMNPTYKHILNLFKTLLNIQKFDTVWNYNNERFSIIENHMKTADKSFVGAIDYSSKTIKDLIEYDKPFSRSRLQMTVRVSLNNKAGILHLIQFLYDDIYVVNMSVDSNYMYISMYTDFISDIKRFSKWVSVWYGY